MEPQLRILSEHLIPSTELYVRAQLDVNVIITLDYLWYDIYLNLFQLYALCFPFCLLIEN
jgi:hypothetical protein